MTSWGGDIIAAACTHIGATVAPELLEGVWLAVDSIEGHYDQENGIGIEGGHIKRPQGPGLGIVPEDSLFGIPVDVLLKAAPMKSRRSSSIAYLLGGSIQIMM